jgi:hypothetical protein
MFPIRHVIQSNPNLQTDASVSQNMSSSTHSDSDDVEVSSTNSSPKTPPRKRRVPRAAVSSRLIYLEVSRTNLVQLRNATLVIPRTGERVRRSVTLSTPSLPSNGNANSFSSLPHLRSRFSAFEDNDTPWDDIKTAFVELWRLITSPTGSSVLKASLAYVLGSLATLVPAVASLLGHNDGKHIVATITVYFHPARTAGSMIEAIVLALIAFAYAALISFGSMGVSFFFGSHGLLVLGHVIVLLVFCGGGLGALGWLKQKLNNPLVNVVSLSCLYDVTNEAVVLTRISRNNHRVDQRGSCADGAFLCYQGVSGIANDPDGNVIFSSSQLSGRSQISSQTCQRRSGRNN